MLLRSLPQQFPSEYASWKAMRNRCSNPTNASYRYYGAKGITVCARWESFKAFLADMGRRPWDCTLDRLDNGKGYEPGNCRWATRKSQAGNRSNARSRRRPTRIPGYCVHKASGCAYVTISGREHYLGRPFSRESWAEYNRLIAPLLGVVLPTENCLPLRGD